MAEVSRLYFTRINCIALFSVAGVITPALATADAWFGISTNCILITPPIGRLKVHTKVDWCTGSAIVPITRLALANKTVFFAQRAIAREAYVTFTLSLAGSCHGAIGKLAAPTIENRLTLVNALTVC